MTKQEFINKYGDVGVEVSSYYKYNFTFTGEYGDVGVKFSSYYKYNFTLTGEFDDGVVVVDVVADSSDIYRMEVCSGSSESVGGLDPYSGYFVKGGVVVDSFYE